MLSRRWTLVDLLINAVNKRVIGSVIAVLGFGVNLANADSVYYDVVQMPTGTTVLKISQGSTNSYSSVVNAGLDSVKIFTDARAIVASVSVTGGDPNASNQTVDKVWDLNGAPISAGMTCGSLIRVGSGLLDNCSTGWKRFDLKTRSWDTTFALSSQYNAFTNVYFDQTNYFEISTKNSQGATVYGVADSTGKIILPPQYGPIFPGNISGQFIVGSVGESCVMNGEFPANIVDQSGNVIFSGVDVGGCGIGNNYDTVGGKPAVWVGQKLYDMQSKALLIDASNINISGASLIAYDTPRFSNNRHKFDFGFGGQTESIVFDDTGKVIFGTASTGWLDAADTSSDCLNSGFAVLINPQGGRTLSFYSTTQNRIIASQVNHPGIICPNASSGFGRLSFGTGSAQMALVFDKSGNIYEPKPFPYTYNQNVNGVETPVTVSVTAVDYTVIDPKNLIFIGRYLNPDPSGPGLSGYKLFDSGGNVLGDFLGLAFWNTVFPPSSPMSTGVFFASTYADGSGTLAPTNFTIYKYAGGAQPPTVVQSGFSLVTQINYLGDGPLSANSGMSFSILNSQGQTVVPPGSASSYDAITNSNGVQYVLVSLTNGSTEALSPSGAPIKTINGKMLKFFYLSDLSSPAYTVWLMPDNSVHIYDDSLNEVKSHP